MINNLKNIIRTSADIFFSEMCLFLFLFGPQHFLMYFSSLLSFCLSSSGLISLFCRFPSLCLSLLWRHILSAWLLSYDFFSLGGVCQGWRVGEFRYVRLKTSKSLSFNDFDTSQVCCVCLCLCIRLPQDFQMMFLDFLESDVTFAAALIKCGFLCCSLQHTRLLPFWPVQHHE